MIDHWSAYWRQGSLTSLPEDFSGLYDGEIEAFWGSQVQAVSRLGPMLDVCTGNGAVAFLLARHAPEAHIVAIDAAQIQPKIAASPHAELTKLAERITFRGGVRVEDVAPSDGEGPYSLVTSHYGVEYADWAQSASAISRCLAPNGRFACIAHAPDTAMIEVMRGEAMEYVQLHRSGWIKVLGEFVGDRTGRYPAATVKANLARSRKQIGQGGQLMTTIHQSSQALEAMSDQQLLSERPRIAGFLAQLTFGEQRLRDMLNVNERLKAHPDWHRCFLDAGLRLLESGTLYYGPRGHRCGTFYVFTR